MVSGFSALIDLTKSDRHTREVITAVPGVEGFEGAGMGRKITLHESQTIKTILMRIANELGVLSPYDEVPLAVPYRFRQNVDDPFEIEIKTIAVCAGSGGSLLKNVDADLLVTGEMSHHETLAAIEKGQCVMAPFHTNTERGYLRQVLRPKLEQAVEEEWKPERKPPADVGFDVSVSIADGDPYEIFTF
ncbi:MAG: hypothetical protein M1832_003496 [Thelocarpon impressellum]|nr:MAG: hypothetical protein M1832_003496 [Thelocarpon impressellum]